MISRTDKMIRELQRIVGMFINEQSNRQSLITVTRCDISDDMKNATVYVSVLPRDKEETALIFLNRLRTEARDYLKANLRTRTIPFLHFEADLGEYHRQHIEELSYSIKKEENSSL